MPWPHLSRIRPRRILDAGAGTGIVGERLSEQGFTNLVALDFSEDILQQAQAKGCYQDLIVANLNAPLAEIPDHSFDAVIAVGVFSYGQVQVQALHEMVRITRSQGFLAFTQRVDFHESDAMGFKSHQDSLEASERIVLVCLTEPAQYLPRKDPDVMFRTWVYQVKW